MKTLYKFAYIIIFAYLLLALISFLPAPVEGHVAGQPGELFNLINEDRAQIGLSAFGYDNTLEKIAADHASNMRRYKYMAHRYWDAETQTFQPMTFLTAKYGWTNGIGECILRGASKASEALWMFKGSSAHWQALMSTSYKIVGIAKASDYWSVILSW